MSTGAYNTTHLRSLLAPLTCFFLLFFFIDQFLIFLLLVLLFLFSLGAAIGYLMQIFFISLHFLYDKGLLLPVSF